MNSNGNYVTKSDYSLGVIAQAKELVKALDYSTYNSLDDYKAAINDIIASAKVETDGIEELDALISDVDSSDMSS